MNDRTDWMNKKAEGDKRKFVVDHDFNYIMATDVKIAIATAFIYLKADLNQAENYKRLSERSISLLEKKARQMKQEINNFIDSQIDIIIAGSEVREQNAHRVPE